MQFIVNLRGDIHITPLTDRIYRDSAWLTAGFVQRVDELLDSFADTSGYDPFLCAQDVPQEVTVGQAGIDGEQASLDVTTSFIDHRFSVELRSRDSSWLIDNIRCLFDDQENPSEGSGEAGSSGARIEGWQVFVDDEYGFPAGLECPQNSPDFGTHDGCQTFRCLVEDE